MFKYAPGMESGLGAALNMMRKHAEPDGDEGTTVTNIFNMEDKESGMNDIAGLQYIYEETRENPEERQELYNFIHMIKG